MTLERDPYDVLGISRQASAAEIARAYRHGARATHPDSRPDDPSASEKFKDLAAAYAILSNPNRRAAYDRHSRTVPVAVGRRPRYGPPPVQPLRRGRATRRFPAGFGPTYFDVGPPPRSGWFEMNVGGRYVVSRTRFEDQTLQMALETLRRLRLSRF